MGPRARPGKYAGVAQEQAVELRPLKEQVDANVKVIQQSNGLLAPVKGSERFLTLGTGHMAAFCRAANHGCWTSIANLQGSNKVIDIIDLKL